MWSVRESSQEGLDISNVVAKEGQMSKPGTFTSGGGYKMGAPPAVRPRRIYRKEKKGSKQSEVKEIYQALYADFTGRI